MKEESSLKKNILYQTSYQVLQVITPLITSPYLARVLGAEKIGIYNYCYSAVYLFGIFAFLGLGNYGNRSIARIPRDDIDQRSRVFFEIVIMQWLSSAIILILYVSYFVMYGYVYKFLFSIELLYLMSVALDISWFYFGIEEFKTTTLRSGTIKLISIILIVLLVKSDRDLWIYTFIMAGGSFASSMILWIFLWGKIKRVCIPISNVKKHVIPNIVLFIPVVSIALFQYMDKVMLGSLSSMTELGYYSNADKIINIPLGIIFGLGVVMLPRISSLVDTDDRASVNYYINNSIVYCMWIGSAICFGIIGVSRDFVPFFFGAGFDRCSDLLMIFAPVVLIKAWSSIFRNQCLIPHGMDREFNISVITAAIINVLFNYTTIPRLGAVGAVLGTIIAEMVVAGLYTYFSKHYVKIRRSVFISVCFIGCGLVMSGCIKLCSICLHDYRIITRLIIEFIVGAVIYLVLSSIFFNTVLRVRIIDVLKKNCIIKCFCKEDVNEK